MTDRDNDDCIVMLPDVLDLNSILQLKTILLNSSERSKSDIIDCSKVSRITTPAVQVILAYAKTLTLEGREPRLQNPSEAFSRAFSDLGLHDNLLNWSTP